MARDEIFQVRHQDIPSVGESNSDRAIMNRFGSQVVTDLFVQWFLSGYTFHMQAGTEDAPVTTFGPLDATKGLIVADNNSGFMVPMRFTVGLKLTDTAINIMAMLEVDMDKKRYSSGGGAFVPEQLNGAASGAGAANGSFYTIDGGDLVIAAKSTVPASVEIGRVILNDDAISNPANGFLGGLPDVYNIRRDAPVGMDTPGSIVAQLGSASLDVTGYGVLDFAQLPSSLVW